MNKKDIHSILEQASRVQCKMCLVKCLYFYFQTNSVEPTRLSARASDAFEKWRKWKMEEDDVKAG